jgi:hypothetical protein
MSDPIPPAQQYHIYLDLSVNAELINTSQSTPVRLSISSDSEDIFYVSEEGIYILEKSFVVQGTNNELALVCRFIVTTENVSLNSKWLEVNAENELSKTGTTGDPLTLPPMQINKFQ